VTQAVIGPDGREDHGWTTPHDEHRLLGDDTEGDEGKADDGPEHKAEGGVGAIYEQQHGSRSFRVGGLIG
jgi:hypothetical protein